MVQNRPWTLGGTRTHTLSTLEAGFLLGKTEKRRFDKARI